MAQIKFLWIIADLLGGSMSILGIINNLDNIKSAIIAILAIVYLMVRVYFEVVRRSQAVREKEIDLWHKEMDKKERISQMNKNKL